MAHPNVKYYNILESKRKSAKRRRDKLKKEAEAKDPVALKTVAKEREQQRKRNAKRKKQRKAKAKAKAALRRKESTDLSWLESTPSHGRRMREVVKERCRQRLLTYQGGRWVSESVEPTVEVQFLSTDNFTYIDQLVLKASTQPGAGRGIFSARPFVKGEVVSLYCGVLKNSPTQPLKHRYALASHNNQKIIDAAGRDNYLFAHFINHAPKGTANCIFVKGGLLVTSRAIDKGEEFFVDYGDSFVGVS